MSLLSLLIALMAEKSLSSSVWRFDHYYQKYINFFLNKVTFAKDHGSTLSYTLFLLIPVAVVYTILQLVDDGLLHLIISTLILIVCFGCVATKKRYKEYLHASFQGEETSAALHHKQLLQDKNLPEMSFGQALIWLNYRYYIAVMLFFVIFGVAGVVFYRLLTTVIEKQNGCSLDTKHTDDKGPIQSQAFSNESSTIDELKSSIDEPEEPISEKANERANEQTNEQNSQVTKSYGCNNYHQILFYLDWLPVRITSFGYMFVGHFSKALPMWLESLFDFQKPAHKILIDVAQKSEDIMVDKDDCTAEPCLLVRLAKRNVLLVLSVISILTLVGLVN